MPRLDVSRRRFLLGAGGAALTLPFLPSLQGESRAEDAPAKAKRFIFLFTSNGQRPFNWYPQDPQSWTVTSAADSMREAPLTQYEGKGGLSRIFGPEFDPFLSKMLLFRGLDFVNRNGPSHHPPTPLSGFSGGMQQEPQGPTIDQIMAESSAVYPAAPPVRSVHMMVKQDFQSPTTCSVTKTLAGIPHQTSVSATYDLLFGDFVQDEDPVAKQRAALKLSALERVRSAYEEIRQHPRLGTEDRQRLETHRDLISDLSDRLSAVSAACSKPDAIADIPLDVDENLGPATTANVDMLVAAILCDRTRVATYMLCPGTDLRNFAYLGGPGGEHHNLSHEAAYEYDPQPGGQHEALAFANNWYAKQVADLMAKLDAIVEDPMTGRTYLDNSIVYWGNEDGCNGYDAHVHHAMPVMIAGGGGVFQMGRYIDYRQDGVSIKYDYNGETAYIPSDWKGRPYNSLLISLLQAMGVPPAEYEINGPGIGDYADNYLDQYSIADGQKPLPFLT